MSVNIDKGDIDPALSQVIIVIVYLILAAKRLD